MTLEDKDVDDALGVPHFDRTDPYVEYSLSDLRSAYRLGYEDAYWSSDADSRD